MARKYGVSVLSLWPWSAGSRGVDVSFEMVLSAGFDGVQVLPLRGWTYEKIIPYTKYIISQEDSFSNGGFIDSFVNSAKAVIGIENNSFPRIEDWILFGDNQFIPNIGDETLKCVHGWDEDGDVYEINPDFCTSADEWLLKASQGFKMCIDTRHLRFGNRRRGKNTPIIDAPSKLLEGLSGEDIHLIHVNPMTNLNGDEEEYLLELRSGPFLSFLNKIGKKSSAPVVLEVVPPMIKNLKKFRYLSKKGTVKYLEQMLDSLRFCFGE